MLFFLLRIIKKGISSYNPFRLWFTGVILEIKSVISTGKGVKLNFMVRKVKHITLKQRNSQTSSLSE